MAIVAHELGHWKKNDTYKKLIFNIVSIYFQFFCFSYAYEYTDMPADFGLRDDPLHGKSVFMSLYIFYMSFEPVLVVMLLIENYITRKIEFNADKFAI